MIDSCRRAEWRLAHARQQIYYLGATEVYADRVTDVVEQLQCAASCGSGEFGLFGCLVRPSQVSPCNTLEPAISGGSKEFGRAAEVLDRTVEVPGQIKTVGTHPVTVRLHPEVTTQVEIAVVAT